MASLELQARLDNLLSIAQAETADIDLFAPIIIVERDECPICMIPLHINETETVFMSCCGKQICGGCIFTHKMTDFMNGVPIHEMKCAFCCQPTPTKVIKCLKKLMKKNNPGAFMQMADHYKRGQEVFQSDTKSLEMLIRAAELGNAKAFVHIGYHYKEEDMSKALEFWEVAAKKGSVRAHTYLAGFHQRNGDLKKSFKHWRVAASAGDKYSMDTLVKAYRDKQMSKEDLTQILREFQASSDAMGSKDRENARVLG